MNKTEQIDKLKKFKDVEKMTAQERLLYYSDIRSMCIKRKIKEHTTVALSRMVLRMVPLLRSFDIEVRGWDNISKEDTYIFLCNHSNTHDIFVMNEVLAAINEPVTFLVASDGLSAISKLLFRLLGGVFIIRDDELSKKKGILDICTHVLNKRNCYIFGEATWNLHPVKPMQPVKAGATQVALITEKRIVPTILEYVEVPHICKKERELYSKVIVCFGKPVNISVEDGLFKQTESIQKEMERMRKELWNELGICKKCLSDIDRNVYLNHLYIKKNKALGFKYNSEHETKFILRQNGQYENEYCIDENGEFVPDFRIQLK